MLRRIVNKTNGMLRLTGLWIGLYPVLAHLGIWTSSHRLVVLYLLGVLLFVLLYPPRYQQAKNILLAISLIAGVVVLMMLELDYVLIFLPPVFIPFVLLVVFMQSLGSSQVPLITQFAEKIEGGNLDSERKVYTRHVTQLWVVVFVIMIVEAIGLGIWASIDIWSWFTHIGNYVLIATILLFEFIYRCYRFNLKNTSFIQFVSDLMRFQWK